LTRNAAAGLVLLAAIGAGVLRARVMDHALASRRYEDVYYVPPPQWLPVVSLGWREALADVLWMRALVYFGDEVIAQGALAHVFDYTDAMLVLDPDFRAVYHWIGTAGIYRPQEPSPADVRRAIDVMRRGIDRFPDDGELAWTLGASLAFELPPLLDDERERDEARSEGADYLALAARLGAAPEWAALANASILDRVGRTDAAVRHLEEMYASVQDEDVRAQIAEAIAAMRSQMEAEAFVEATRAEEEARAGELPYLDEDLYFLVGPRPVTPWREVYRDGFGRLLDDRPELEGEP
jgi:hypothetical protein